MDYQTHSRPRAKSGFSFRSNKSDDSKSSKPKVDLHETEADKKRFHMQEGTKANPNTAINDAQPATVAHQKTTLGSIRSVEWKDSNGDVIVDPDLSNPTRSRWERPLDTIRSFEAAIDGGYKKRQSIVRAESEGPNGYASRRSSYFGGNCNDQSYNNRSPQMNGYYGSRAAPPRPDSSFYHDGYGAGPVPPRHRYGQRLNSDPALARYNSQGQNVYPTHGYHQSHDTVNTGISNGSDATGPWANSTDPSSENSSIDRVNPPNPPKPEPTETYGLNGFGGAPNFQGPILEEYGAGSHGVAYPRSFAYGGPQNGNGPTQFNDIPPAPPPKASQPQGHRKLMKLNSAGDVTPQQYDAYGQPARQQSTQNSGEKRKSWFKRRFSKD
ncbi:MAG: hypothetical protein M1820_007243 [Bogoriella megaspora]|nr:MAG: hypothetical protein M1820_007243 [Bogoriella megaspora]